MLRDIVKARTVWEESHGGVLTVGRLMPKTDDLVVENTLLDRLGTCPQLLCRTVSVARFLQTLHTQDVVFRSRAARVCHKRCVDLHTLLSNVVPFSMLILRPGLPRSMDVSPIHGSVANSECILFKSKFISKVSIDRRPIYLIDVCVDFVGK